MFVAGRKPRFSKDRRPKRAPLPTKQRQDPDTAEELPSNGRQADGQNRAFFRLVAIQRLARRLLVAWTMAVSPVSALTTTPTLAIPAERSALSVQFQKDLRRAALAPTAVPAHRTQLTAAEARKSLQEAWTERFGQPPPEETLAILTAQWSHETGEGKSMYNFNFAGIKGVGPSGLHVTQRTREGYGESEHIIRDSFRAYESAKEGALDYLSLLDRKYPGALESARAGDVKGFVSELHAGGYFTGDKRVYERSVSRHATRLLESGPLPLESSGTLEPGLISTPEPGYRVAQTNPHPRELSSPSAQGSDAARAPEHATAYPVDEFQLQSFTDQLALAALRIASATDPARG